MKTENNLDNDKQFPLRKENYIMVIAGVVVVLLGFMLMAGGGSEDPTVFNADELFSWRRITLAPIVVLAGFGVVLYGIMKKSKSE